MQYDNDFPTGEPFLDKSRLNQIATQLDELIIKFDALRRFHEMVMEWDEEMGRKLAARAIWQERRGVHEQNALTQQRLLDKNAGPPEPGWCFEVFRRDLTNPRAYGVGPPAAAWFSADLCCAACPEVGWPLPVPRVEVKLCEMYAAVSAIYNRTTKGNRKINPWVDDPDELAGIRFYDLIDMVPNLPKSDASHLSGWIRRIEKDLQAGEDSAGNASRTALGPDGASINWYGQTFTFTPQQRPIIGALWEARKDGLRGLSVEHLLSIADAKRKTRLPDIFKGSPAWNTLIERVPKTNDLYRLAEPEDQQ